MLRYFLILLLFIQTTVFAASREALVIGNSGYEQGHGLDGNPLRDAETMANVLKQVGFSVILKEDLNLSEMEEAVRTFQSRLNENTVALFYFSGHGVQRDGENYLIPLGAIRSIVAPGHLKDKTMNVNYVLSVMENAKSAVNLVFLDACRDNPFKSLFKGNATVGLATPRETPSGTLIAYATKAGAQSWTGEKGDNSPFVKVLAQEMAKPGVPITEMLTKVRMGVMQATDNSQAPSYYNELNSTFCFVEPCGQSSQAEADRLKKLEEEIEKLKRGSGSSSSSTTTVTESPTAGKTFRDKLKDGSLGPEVVQIPGGTFQMGSNDGESDEKPVHTVTVKSFAMGKYEATRGEFRKFVEATSYKTDAEKGDGCYGWTGSEWKKDSSFNWKNVGFTQDDKHPVVCVSWNDAKAYVKWLSEQTGKDYRLPTEAQWEYAARAGTTTKYWWGNEIGKNNANCDGCGSQWDNKQTAPVGSFKPNPFGLYDVSGNVWEWLEDKWHDSYNGAPVDGSAWMSGDSNFHLLRGGSWSGSDGDDLRCADRAGGDTTNGGNFRGLRISRVNL